MDRTREFRAIVQATEIPQPSTPPVDFYRGLHACGLEIAGVLGALERLTSYEAFRAQPLLDRGYALVREYRETPIDEGAAGQNTEVTAALRAIVRTNALRATLRLNEAARRCGHSGKRVQSSHLLDEHPENRKEDGQGLIQEELEQASYEPQNEQLQERRRVVRSISEIGQIVEDIAIHVSLQEEQLRRIDESMGQTEQWSKKALRELRETWEIAGENRSGMLKFFGFWLLVFVVFWFAKR